MAIKKKIPKIVANPPLHELNRAAAATQKGLKAQKQAEALTQLKELLGVDNIDLSGTSGSNDNEE